jgi:triacylglycerol lipase
LTRDSALSNKRLPAANEEKTVMTPFLRRSLSSTLSAWGLVLLTASGCGAPAPAGDRDPAPVTVRRGAATAGPRTSPFEPQKESDRNFVTDAGSKLDTGCIYRSSGPIEFDIDVTRYLGPLKADGTLANADALIAAGLLGPTATLSMPGYDVDSGAAPTPDVQPERDRVWFNGEEIGFLSGETDTWKLNSFQIDIRKVRFASRADAGAFLVPAINHVTIDIDVANADQDWCTSIDWGALSFRAASPVILVHGNNSDGGFFDRQGFVAELAAEGRIVDNSITMPTDTVASHGWLLNTQIPAIAKSLGATSVHLVAHSKGGLDVREYLALYQPNHDKDFKVLSYTTLSTPHNGSALADLAVQRDAAVESLAKREFVGFPTFTETILNQLPTDIGTTNLTTAFTASFNISTLFGISPATVFNTVAADADINGNGTIDHIPDEYLEIRDENKDLRDAYALPGGSFATDAIVNVMHEILRSTASVGLRIERRNGMLGTTTVAVVTANPTAQPLGNDLLVTIPSGQGEGSIATRVANTHVFTGSDGRNHSSVANGRVAATVANWLFDIERTSGGLQ